MPTQQKTTNSAAIQQALNFAYAHQKPIAPIESIFHIEPAGKAPKVWLLVADCPVCSTPIPLFRDPAAGSSGNPFSGSGSFRAECPVCKQDRILMVTVVYAAQSG